MQRKTTLLLALLGIIIISLTIESLNSQNKPSLLNPFFITTDQTQTNCLTTNNTLENYVETEDDSMKNLSIVYQSQFAGNYETYTYQCAYYNSLIFYIKDQKLYSTTDYLTSTLIRDYATEKVALTVISNVLYVTTYVATDKWRLDTYNGSSWTIGTTYNLPYTSSPVDYVGVYPCFTLGGSIYCVFYMGTTGTILAKMIFIKSDNSANYPTSDTSYTGFGTLVSSKYYFVGTTYSGGSSTDTSFNLYSFNGTTITLEESNIITKTTDGYQHINLGLFYIKGNWIMANLVAQASPITNVYFKGIGYDSYVLSASVSTYGFSIITDTSNIVKYFVVGQNVYRFSNSSLCFIGSTTNSVITVHHTIDPYLITYGLTGTFLYKLQPTTNTSITSSKYLYPLQASPSAQIQSNVQYANNQYLVLYSDLDVEEFEGYVDLTNGLSIDPIMEYKLVSLAEQDLTRDIYITESSATAGTIITNAINNNCLGITVGTISTSTPSTVYTFSNYKTTLKLLLDLFNYNHGYRWQLAPNLALSWNNGTVDTGIDCVAPTDAMTVPTRTLLTLSKGRIEVIGMGTNGTILTGVYQASTSFGVFRYYRLDLKTQTEVDTMALALGTTQNQNPYQYTFTVFGKALIQVGNQITFGGTDSAFTLASAQAYVTNVEYDAISQEQRVVVVDLFYQEKPKDNGLTNDTLLTEVSATTVRVNTLETTTVPTTRTISTTAPLSGGGDLSANRTLTFDPTAVPYLKQDSSNDYKNLYADAWGTSGTPSGWSLLNTPTTYSIVSSYSNHAYPEHIIGDAGSYEGIQKDITSMASGYFSFWIYPSQTNKEIGVAGYNIANAVYPFGIQFGTDSYIYVRNAAGTGHTSTGMTYSSKWYHFYINWTQNSTVFYCIDGVLVITVTSTVNYPTTRIFTNTNGGDYYFDAYYGGDSHLKAWSSLYAGIIASPQFFTQYGEIVKAYTDASISPSWTNATYENSWVTYSAAWGDVAYRKIGKTVQIRGLAKNGSAANAVIFTLPTGYRPSYNVMRTTYSNNGVCLIYINTSGQVYANTNGSTTWTSVGLTFGID